MVAGNDQSRPARTPLTAVPTFELERFEWGAPHRLEVSGTFGGLRDVPMDGSPVLVVRAGERMHRLPAIPDGLAGPPEEGRLWRSAFAWQDAPVAFDVAELQLGADIVVQLPKAGAKRRLSRHRVLEVRTARAGSGGDLRRETEGAARDVRVERASEQSDRQGRPERAGPPREDSSPRARPPRRRARQCASRPRAPRRASPSRSPCSPLLGLFAMFLAVRQTLRVLR